MISEFRVVIAGSRTFCSSDCYKLLKEEMDNLLSMIDIKQYDIIIVSGTANGADKLGERYAKEKGYKIERYPADWSIGKQAGYIRNSQMADVANACAIFCVNKSKGSMHMYDLCVGKDVQVELFDIKI